MKLDIGCGDHPKDGFEGVDAIEDVKYKIDVTKEWKWKNDTVDEINATHFLEHLTPEQGLRFLSNCIKSLKVGGKLTIEVPDLEWCCRFFLDNPGKRYRLPFPKGDKIEMIGEDQATVFIFGMSWYNEFEIHRFGYTKKYLFDILRCTGFCDIRINDIYSHGCQCIEAVCYKCSE